MNRSSTHCSPTTGFVKSFAVLDVLASKKHRRFVASTRAACTSLVVAFGIAVATPAPARAGGMPQLVIHHHGVTVVRPDEGSRVVLDEHFAVPTPDARAIATATAQMRGPNAMTDVRVVDAATGRDRWRVSAPGQWRPQAVSRDGAQVLLGPVSTADSRTTSPYAIPPKREHTSLLHVTSTGAMTAISLPGTLVAEAFSADGANVVMIEYVYDAPTGSIGVGNASAKNATAENALMKEAHSYRVRPLHLASGALGTQRGSVKPLTNATNVRLAAPPTSVALEEEVMRGVRHNQTWDPKGTALFTLYDASSDGASSLFIHALNLEKVTAQCLPVPDEIGAGNGRGTVLFVEKGASDELIVVGARGIAAVDAQTGAVRRITKFATPTRPVLAASTSRLWVGSGATITEFSFGDLRELKRYRLNVPARAITPLAYGPLGVLDTNGTIWFAGPGVDRPIRRGEARGILGDEVLARFAV